MHGIVTAICICPAKGERMQEVLTVKAMAGKGLQGDRYATSEGSFSNKKKPWWTKIPIIGSFFRHKNNRQVTLINGIFFQGTGFTFADSRRNIVVNGIELNWLAGRKFTIGTACFRGVKYCDPCTRPNMLAGKERSFKEAFFDRGGLIAEIITGGEIKIGDPVIPPPKGY